MPDKPKYTCIHEDQIQGQSRKIAELETKAIYKEKMIVDLNEKMDKMGDKLDKIDHCVSDLKLQSERDDFNIDNRVTQLETTNKTLKWVISIGFSALTTAVAVMAFLIVHLH